MSDAVVKFRVRAGIFSNKRTQSLSVALAWVFVQSGQIFLRHAGIYGLVVYLAMVGLFVANLLWPTTISVGSDGVLVAGLVRRSFYPFAKIVGVKTSNWGVVLERENGRTIEIRTEANANRGRSSKRDTLLGCIQRRVADLAASPTDEATSVLLARGGRSVEEWARDLRALAVGQAGGYRAASIPTEELWRILEDPKSDPTARAGAAVALRSSLNEEGRARIRVVAEQCASPKIRVALEAAAGGTSDGEVEAALAECEPEVESRRAAS